MLYEVEPAVSRRHRMEKTLFPESIKPLNRESVSSAIMNLITDYLLSKRLSPGDKLPTEAELAQQFGVGRNSVREAMKMLSSLGVVEIRRGVGTFIPETMSESVFNPIILGLVFEQGTSKELIELRLYLDTCVAEMVMQKATDADIQELESANNRLKEAAAEASLESGALRDLDMNFHLTMLRITGNKLLLRLGKAIYTLFRASIEKSVSEDPFMAFRNHQLVLEGIKKRNRKLIREFTGESLSFWMTTIDGQTRTGESAMKEVRQ